ncbi:MAG: GDP-mannose 4,6-dehydratase [Candidatus Diapherotrites archaeon]|uniref:GDP-mannose 4,6-dehydratase n=1 Tax=Candidatus Iainarchaeum sp. TaxID=3101447 RepID=A0A938YX18_9ARCH|nr:GDP-mannose 4,6-dehydratase [Candidatus Diapherotrites archaeon]
MEKILITGVNGFVGSHLCDLILEKGYGEITGLIRTKNANMENIAHIKDRLNLLVSDISDYHSISKAIEESEPDIIFHLAAQSFVPASWRAPIETMNANVMGSLNLFEAVRNSKSNPVIQIAGSSEEYGYVAESELPITELQELRPLSPYGVSKAAMDLLGYQYNKSYGLKIIRTRAFNHTGPRRGEVFVCSDWSKQIVEIEKGKKKPVMLVGNLDPKRDFSDVRDIVKAYWLAVKKCEPGEVYNICQENTIKMKGILDLLLSMTGKKISIEQDPKRMRPSDVPVLYGSCKKFREKTGWKPEIEFKQTLEDIMQYWRERL